MQRFTSKRTAIVLWLLLRVGERIARQRAGGGRKARLRGLRKLAISVFVLALVGALLQRKRSASRAEPSPAPVSPPPPAPEVERRDDGPASLP
jgi:hypothetical protein